MWCTVMLAYSCEQILGFSIISDVKLSRKAGRTLTQDKQLASLHGETLQFMTPVVASGSFCLPIFSKKCLPIFATSDDILGIFAYSLYKVHKDCQENSLSLLSEKQVRSKKSSFMSQSNNYKATY